MNTIGYNIRALRESLELTEEYMAEELGVSQSTYSRLEHAGNKIDFEIILAIAKIFKMPPADIIHYAPGHGHDPAPSHESTLHLQRKKEEVFKIVYKELGHALNIMGVDWRDSLTHESITRHWLDFDQRFDHKIVQ